MSTLAGLAGRTVRGVVGEGRVQLHLAGVVRGAVPVQSLMETSACPLVLIGEVSADIAETSPTPGELHTAT